MKTVSRRSFFAMAILMLAILMPSIANAAKTHITKVARISTPPSGRSLVNIHRILGGPIRSPIFDESGIFLMDLPGDSECQIVCNPGQKTFISWYGANPINVVTAELAPDKTYDLLIYLDVWRGIFFIPTSQAPHKLRDLEKLEKKEADKVFTLERDEVALNFEASQKSRIEQIKTDFLGGEKSSRVVHVNKNDCR